MCKARKSIASDICCWMTILLYRRAAARTYRFGRTAKREHLIVSTLLFRVTNECLDTINLALEGKKLGS